MWQSLVLAVAWAVASADDAVAAQHEHLEDCPLQIHWMAPFFSGGGYCSEATAYVQLLTDFSAPLTVSIDQHGDSFNRRYAAGLPSSTQHLLTQAYTLPVPAVQTMAICHSEPGAWAAPAANYATSKCPPRAAGLAIGRTMFESDRIPDGWDKRLRYMNEIWVPTRWAAQIFQAWASTAGQPLAVRVLPEPVNVAEFTPGQSLPPQYQDMVAQDAQLAPGVQRIRLLSVFKWEWRKGWDLLLQAYWGAFTTADPVILYILTSAYHSSSDFHGHIHRHARTACACSTVQAGVESQIALALQHITGEQPLPHTRAQARTAHLAFDPEAAHQRYSTDAHALAHTWWVPALLAALETGPAANSSALVLTAPAETWCFDFSEHEAQVPAGHIDVATPLPATLARQYHWPASTVIRVHVRARSFQTAPAVRLVERVPQAQLPAIFAGAHAFVLPSRGEGWGRPHVEAMASGIPVIATNWSGPTAFLDDSVGWPVSFRGLVRVPDGPFSSHYMASPNVTDLMHAMHQAVLQPVARAARGAAARARMVSKFAGAAMYSQLARTIRAACQPAIGVASPPSTAEDEL